MTMILGVLAPSRRERERPPVPTNHALRLQAFSDYESYTLPEEEETFR